MHQCSARCPIRFEKVQPARMEVELNIVTAIRYAVDESSDPQIAEKARLQGFNEKCRLNVGICEAIQQEAESLFAAVHRAAHCLLSDRPASKRLRECPADIKFRIDRDADLGLGHRRLRGSLRRAENWLVGAI